MFTMQCILQDNRIFAFRACSKRHQHHQTVNAMSIGFFAVHKSSTEQETFSFLRYLLSSITLIFKKVINFDVKREKKCFLNT